MTTDTVVLKYISSKIPDIGCVTEKTFDLIRLYLYIADVLYHSIKAEINKQVDCQTYDYNVKYGIEIQEVVTNEVYEKNIHPSMCGFNIKKINMMIIIGKVEVTLNGDTINGILVNVKANNNVPKSLSTNELKFCTYQEIIDRLMDVINKAIPDYTLPEYGIVKLPAGLERKQLANRNIIYKSYIDDINFLQAYEKIIYDIIYNHHLEINEFNPTKDPLKLVPVFKETFDRIFITQYSVNNPSKIQNGYPIVMCISYEHCHVIIHLNENSASATVKIIDERNIVINNGVTSSYPKYYTINKKESPISEKTKFEDTLKTMFHGKQ